MTLLFKAIKTDKDQQYLQTDLSSLEQWEAMWQMEFNPSKCTVIQISKRQPKPSSYILHNVTLDTVENSKYLGVTFNNHLTWQDHINATTTKAMKVLGFLRRNLHDCSCKVKAASYSTMVRPILEYSAVVWDPHLEKEKKLLENVQRRAARFATRNYFERTPGCVERMLQELNWEKLELRRQKLRLSFLHKINYNLVDININNFFNRSDSRTRGSQRLQQSFTADTILFNSFFPKTVREWNKLPTTLTAIEAPETFRARLGGIVTSHQATLH